MATINSTAIDTVLSKRAPLVFVDSVSRDSEFFARIRKEPVGDPRGPRWKSKQTGSSSAATFAEGASFPAGSKFVEQEASLDWGQYVATCRFSGKALRILAAGGGELQISNYIAAQLEDAMKDLVAAVEADLLSGANTDGITGITAAISDSNTYAGLARGTYSNWQSYENTTASSITMAILDDMWSNLVISRKGKASVIFTTQAVVDDYTTLSSGNGAPAAPQGMPGGEFVAGYTGARYRGIPFVAFNGYTADRLDMIDESQLSLVELDGGVQTSPMAPVQGTDDWVCYLTYFAQMQFLNPRLGSAYTLSLT